MYVSSVRNTTHSFFLWNILNNIPIGNAQPGANLVQNRHADLFVTIDFRPCVGRDATPAAARNFCNLNSSIFQFLPFLLFQNQRLEVGCDLAINDCAGTQMSESLCALVTGLMTVRAVEHFYLAVGGYGKSLGRCLMCLDLSHFYSPFL